MTTGRMTCRLVLVLGVSLGCLNKVEEQTKATGSILGKTTQDIGKFDPAAKQKKSDSSVRVDVGPTYAAQAYRPIIEQAAKLQIEHALELYRATNDRYPKDHEEFMNEIIRENNIRLPALPAQWQYQYDVKNHRLEVVEKKP